MLFCRNLGYVICYGLYQAQRLAPKKKKKKKKNPQWVSKEKNKNWRAFPKMEHML
jgi:hypothetical protein